MRLFRRHVALPQDHGSWAFFLGPLIVGLFTGGRWHTSAIYLTVAAGCGFLVRQPIGLMVKVAAGRRGRDVLPAAIFWTALYGAVAALHVTGLVMRGFGYLLVLAVPGMLVFCWYLLLLYRRSERRNWMMEILATGAVALVAPAGMWAGRGAPDPLGWWLWLLMWQQSATGIVYVYLRLAQRSWKRVPTGNGRLSAGMPSLTVAVAGLVLTLVLWQFGVVSRWLWVPYLWQMVEVIRGVRRPALGAKPVAIGVRQLLVKVVFVALFIALW
ncbi:MAG: YwiC-like family protein [bacterium]|nr:YwiC-like family protein [bacterium]